MHYSLKLLIPIGLGVLAAGLNYLTINAGLPQTEFIAAKRTIIAGKTIKKSDLVELPIPQNFEDSLAGLAPQYVERGSIIGQRAVRDVPAGDIVLLADTALGGVEDVNAESHQRVPLGRNSEYSGLFDAGMNVYFRVATQGERGERVYKRLGPFKLLAVRSGKVTAKRARGSEPTLIDEVLVAFDLTNPKTQDLELQRFLDELQKGGIPDPRIYPAAKR